MRVAASRPMIPHFTRWVPSSPQVAVIDQYLVLAPPVDIRGSPPRRTMKHQNGVALNNSHT